MNESPIFTKCYELIKWLLEHTIKFPKSQRFVMAKRLEETLLNLYDALIEAAKAGNGGREALLRADVELERLKHYLRLCMDLKLFSLKQYEYASLQAVEVGRMLGGWLKKK
ncbi:MAG TPA: diversity-generating retroelement protein Avd [Desulfuromonadales bacterium]|nr:diversity-generating retroelement protein Avd [Desulfuromonadales bacterium]